MNIDYDLRSLAESEEINEADILSQLLLQFDLQTENFLRSKFKNKESELKSLIENYKFDKPTFGLSQSKIKSYYSVLEGQVCPKKFKAALLGQRVDLLETSQLMIDGQVFEYIATGQTNYWNEIPDIDSVAKRKMEYIKYQAELWNTFLRKEKHTRFKPGYKIAFENKDFKLTATPDGFSKVAGKPVYTDLKFTDPHGTFGKFAWADSSLQKNSYLLLQAEQVLFIHYMANKEEQAEFIFYIANKASEIDSKARRVVFRDFDKKMEELYLFFSKMYKSIDFLLNNELFEADPDPKNCNICNLDCKIKTKVAVVKNIYID